MGNQESSKKKPSFVKVLLWVVGIFVALQILSGGTFLEEVLHAIGSDGQSDPTSATELVSRPYIGIAGQDTEENTGVLVTDVKAGSPGEKAGIQPGDIITAMGSQKVANSQEFMQVLQAYVPWETVEISLLRDGQALILSVTLGEKTEAVTVPGETPGGDTQSQNTTPPQSGTQEHDRYPSLPADLREHLLLGPRAQGISATLTGNVLITVVFVNDPTSDWTADRMAEIKTQDDAMKAAILAEAAAYGASLNVTIDYRQGTASTTEEADRTAWSEQIMASAGLGSVETASRELERTRGVKEAPILFYVDATERSYALPNTGTVSEYAIVWKGIADTTTPQHELYHLFGAVDLYMPSAVAECAGRYFPGSIMLDGNRTGADDLTAYLIGWTDTLSDKALAFLRETAHITQEEASQEIKEETYTGYVENWKKTNGYIITGYLDFGILEGEGKVIEPNGGWREGYFEFGSLIRGRCKILYEDGGWYEGDYDYGAPHGQGKALYSDGSYYEGSFVKGALEGQGKMAWSDGSSYTGQWKNGQYHGYGKRVDANGGWYEGDFQEGLSHGQGKAVFADGSWYEGDFTQGAINGQGTFVWASGDRYTGAFLNGKFHGYGTYTWADGNSASGMWENGTYIG